MIDTRHTETVGIREILDIVQSHPEGLTSYDIGRMIYGDGVTSGTIAKIAAKCYRLQAQGYLRYVMDHTIGDNRARWVAA